MFKFVAATELVDILRGSFSLDEFVDHTSSLDDVVKTHLLFTKCPGIENIEIPVVAAYSRETGNLLSVTGTPIFPQSDTRPEMEKALSFAESMTASLGGMPYSTLNEDFAEHFMWRFSDGSLTLSIWENNDDTQEVSLNFIR